MWVVWHPLIWGHLGVEAEQTLTARKIYYCVEAGWRLDLQEYCERQSALKRAVLSPWASRVFPRTPGTWCSLVQLLRSQVKWRYHPGTPVPCSSPPVDGKAAAAGRLLRLWGQKVWVRNAGSLLVLLLLLFPVFVSVHFCLQKELLLF